MKFRTLEATAQNIAVSMASGIGLMVGFFEMDVFGEARTSKAGFIEVDFLSGNTPGASVSEYLAAAAKAYAEALPAFLRKQGLASDDFRQLRSRYFARDQRFVVTIEDAKGRTSSREYFGINGARLRVNDPLGRVRRRRNLVGAP